MSSHGSSVPPKSEDSIPRPVEWSNYDNHHIHQGFIREAGLESTTNFIVEFGNDRARAAYNLDSSEIAKLVRTSNSERDPQYPVRWINIWKPHEPTGKESVQLIAQHYGFSKRLAALMMAPRKHEGNDPQPARHPVGAKKEDIEMAMSKPDVKPEVKPDPTIVIQQFLKTTLNYTSTDFGDKFLCVGANWLHSRPKGGQAKKKLTPKSEASMVPPKHWSWIIICSDNDDDDLSSDDDSGTSADAAQKDVPPTPHYFSVISVHEGPWYEKEPEGADGAKWRQEELKQMRVHTINVLTQLSAAWEQENGDILEIKEVRSKGPRRNKRTPTMGSARNGGLTGDTEELKLASSLFYYLFEDYMSAAPIIMKVREALNKLSDAVMKNESHKLNRRENIVPDLHELRKELRQLKHLFQSYKAIVERILGLPGLSNNMGVVQGAPGDMSVLISQSARRRFERLGYLLQLLMLNHIDEFLEDAKALSETYFNLTAQNDSAATARLTRSATLLAKLSVFFLPIGFQTAFFSVEVPTFLDTFTPKMYYISFSIIAGLSFLGIFFFSRVLIVSSEWLDKQTSQLHRKTREELNATREKIGHRLRAFRRGDGNESSNGEG